MKKIILSSAIAACFSAPVIAQELPPIPSSINPVSSGDPATAAQINALVDAINAQSQWIQALADNEADDVAGRTYYLSVIETDFVAIKYGDNPTDNISQVGSGDPEATQGFSVVNMQTSEGTLTFGTDGTAVLDIDENNVGLVTHPASDVGPLPGDIFFDQSTETISYNQNEGLVTLEFPPEQAGDPVETFELYVSRDGQTLMRNERWVLDIDTQQDCFTESAGNNIDDDPAADPGCNVRYESSQVSGIEFMPASL